MLIAIRGLLREAHLHANFDRRLVRLKSFGQDLEAINVDKKLLDAVTLGQLPQQPASHRHCWCMLKVLVHCLHDQADTTLVAHLREVFGVEELLTRQWACQK